MKRFWSGLFLALSILIILTWATAAPALQESSPQAQPGSQASPSGKQSSDKKPDDPTAALITAIAALVTSIGGIIVGVLGLRHNARQAQQISKENITELLKDFNQFEAGMLLVLNKTDHLWELIFNKMGSDDTARQKVAEALVWGISKNPNVRTQLQGLLKDESKVVHVYPTVSSTQVESAHPMLSNEQIDQVQSILKAAFQFAQSSNQTESQPDKKDK